MTPEFGIEALLLLATTVVLVYIVRRLQTPRPRTKHLAMTVWAAFGPYDTAEFAEDGLRWASSAASARASTATTTPCPRARSRGARRAPAAR